MSQQVTRVKRVANDENPPHKKRWSYSSGSAKMMIGDMGLKPLSPTGNTNRFPFARSAPTSLKQPASKRRRKDLKSDSTTTDDDPYSMDNEKEAFPPSFFLFRRRSIASNVDLFNPFDMLPDEMVLKVFKWLPKSTLGSVSQVSKRFLRLGGDESLWKRIDAQGKNFYDDHLPALLAKNPIYLRLSQANLKGAVDERNFGLISGLNLSMLDLSMAEVSPNYLAALLQLCPKLTKLSLEHLNLTDAVGTALLVPSKSLDTLNLAMCYAHDLSPSTLIQFYKSTKLIALNMSWINGNWTSEDLLDIVSALPKGLSQLNIAGYRNTMRDTHVTIISERCLELVDLDLSDSQEITMVGLESISCLEHVQHLAISRCYAIELSAYSLLAGMRSLQFLDLFSLFKEAALKQILAPLKNVEVNQFSFSSIARPTYGNKRSSIWDKRVRD